MVKKRNCNKSTSYQCGKSCISARKVCRKDGLQGQSIDIMVKFKNAVTSTMDTETAKDFTNVIIDRAISKIQELAPKTKIVQEKKTEKTVSGASKFLYETQLEIAKEKLDEASDEEKPEILQKISKLEKKLGVVNKRIEKTEKNDIVPFNPDDFKLIREVEDKLKDQISDSKVKQLSDIRGRLNSLMSENNIVPFERTFSEGEMLEGLDIDELWDEYLVILGNL